MVSEIRQATVNKLLQRTRQSRAEQGVRLTKGLEYP